MPDLFGIDIKGLVADEFGGNLVAGTLTKVTHGARAAGDLTAGRTQTTESVTFDGILQSFKTELIDGTNVQLGDRQVLIIVGTMSEEVEPEQGWSITIEGKTYTVVKLLERDPAGATYLVHVRGGG